jgi:hypothetical protein
MADNRDRTNQGTALGQSGGGQPVDQSDLDATDDRSAVRQPAGGEDLGDQADSPTSTERSTSNKAQGVR